MLILVLILSINVDYFLVYRMYEISIYMLVVDILIVGQTEHLLYVH